MKDLTHSCDRITIADDSYSGGSHCGHYRASSSWLPSPLQAVMPFKIIDFMQCDFGCFVFVNKKT